MSSRRCHLDLGGAGGAVLAVHDELFGTNSIRPGTTIALDDGSSSLRYITRTAAEHTGQAVDGWICPPAPSAPDRFALALTLAGELLEQGGAGELVSNGTRQGPGLLMAWGVLGARDEGALEVGRRATLLIGEKDQDAWHVRIAVTAPLTWVFAQPFATRGVPRVPRWLERATLMSARSTRDLGRRGPR